MTGTVTDARTVEAFIDYVAPYLVAARVPGCGIAVVQPGQPTLIGCYGVSDLATGQPLTETTIFPIASTSKAMNATLIAMLVQDGRLEWDVPVRDYLPGFRLSGTLACERTTLRDLVIMRTGLPRHDWVWWGNPQSRADLLRRVAHLQLTAGFRERFQYSNISATIAGHVAEVVSCQSWETLIEQRILARLGMTDSAAAPLPGVSCTNSYHENTARKILPSPRVSTECTGPSGGSVHSNLADMARWVAFNLSGGTTHPGLLEAAALAAVHAPQIIVGNRPLAAFSSDAAYALGWVVDHFDGERRIHHSGLLHDVSTSVMLLPDLGLGLIAFSNFAAPISAELLNLCALQLLTRRGDPAKALCDRLDRYERALVANIERQARLQPVAGTRPSHVLEAYAGAYGNAGYGVVEITLEGTNLLLRRGELVLPLEHWHYDVWIAAEDDRWAAHLPHPFDRAGQISFSSDADGSIGAVSLGLEPELEPIRFTRRGAREARDCRCVPCKSLSTTAG